MKLEILGLKLPEIEPGANLVKLIVNEAGLEADGIRDGDILAIASKVVSKAYGFLIELEKINPSKMALKIAQKTRGDPKFIQAVLDHSDQILFVFPFSEIFDEITNVEKISKDPVKAYQAMEKAPSKLIVARNKQIYSSAGIDTSNHPEGIASFPPENPDEIAKEIRQQIKEATGCEVAVILTDTEFGLFFGTLDFARGSSGIEVITKNFGEFDLYGKPKFGGVDALVDELACASALLMRQTAEGVPVVIIRGYEYNKSEEGVLDYHLDPKIIKKATRRIMKYSIKLLGLRWLFQFGYKVKR